MTTIPVGDRLTSTPAPPGIQNPLTRRVAPGEQAPCPRLGRAFPYYDDPRGRHSHELLAREVELDEYRRALSLAMAGSGRGVTRDRFKQGTVFATRTPWIFALAWCHFGALAVFLVLHG